MSKLHLFSIYSELSSRESGLDLACAKKTFSSRQSKAVVTLVNNALMESHFKKSQNCLQAVIASFARILNALMQLTTFVCSFAIDNFCK